MTEELVIIVPMAIHMDAKAVARMQAMMDALGVSRETFVARVFMSGLAAMEIEAGASI